MAISIHDNRLISYTVSDSTKTILFETIFDEKMPNEFTNITFSNVSAYFFEHHSLQLGTIFFDIKEIDVEIILENNWERFEEGKKWGWPGFWRIRNKPQRLISKKMPSELLKSAQAAG